MTTAKVNWSELDQKYWLNDVYGGVLWFENSLDAKEALRDVELQQAVLKEREAIADWVDSCRQEHEKYAQRKGEKVARSHHIDACYWIARAIRRGEHEGEFYRD